jgi:hypothetical protein
LAAFDVSAPGGAALDAARLRDIAESVQLDSEARLAAVQAPLFQLPELDGVNGPELLGGLLRALQQASEA